MIYIQDEHGERRLGLARDHSACCQAVPVLASHPDTATNHALLGALCHDVEQLMQTWGCSAFIQRQMNCFLVESQTELQQKCQQHWNLTEEAHINPDRSLSAQLPFSTTRSGANQHQTLQIQSRTPPKHGHYSTAECFIISTLFPSSKPKHGALAWIFIYFLKHMSHFLAISPSKPYWTTSIINIKAIWKLLDLLKAGKHAGSNKGLYERRTCVRGRGDIKH